MVKDLALHCPALCKALGLNKNKWVSEVGYIRNRTAHSEFNRRAPDSQRMFAVHSVLRLMLQTSLLKWLGFEDERCVEMLNRRGQVRLLKRLLSDTDGLAITE